MQELRSKKKDEYIQGRNYFRFKNDEHIVRLHIGLEDPKDLNNDLRGSFEIHKVMQKFFQNRLALIVLLSACSVILVSMGIRQTLVYFIVLSKRV